MLPSFPLLVSKRVASRILFPTLALAVALTTAPGIAHAQLRARSLAKTQNIPQRDDDHNAPVGTPLLQAQAVAIEFGADAQSASNVLAGIRTGGLGANAHACAGTGEVLLPSVSYAEASSLSTSSTLLRVVSPTLPIGTLVDIEFQFRGMVAGHYIKDTAGFDYVTLTADASILVQGAGQNLIARGSYGYQSVRGSGGTATPNKTGLFGADDLVTRVITGVAVGSSINFSSSLELHTDANGGQFTYNSADIKAGVVWGAQVLNSSASLIYGPSSDPFPAQSNANVPDWDTVIPPFQFPVEPGTPSAAPEPGSVALVAVGFIGVVGMSTRRKHRRYF